MRKLIATMFVLNTTSGTMNPYTKIYNSYPDNDDVKLVSLFIDTRSIGKERHCYIGWKNGDTSKGKEVYQQLHLTGGPGNYSFYQLCASEMTIASVNYKVSIPLGEMNRTQRDVLKAIASGVSFDKKSTTENCQTWMIKYMLELVKQGAIASDTCEHALSKTGLSM